MKIKICGIKNIKEIEYMNLIKPDYIGFVFSNSKRKIDYENYITLDKNLKKGMKRVAVFKDEKIEFIKNIVSSSNLDIIQLHGNEDKEYIDCLRTIKDIEVWKAVNGRSNRLKEEISYYNNFVDEILIDSSNAGSGSTFNWEVLRNFEAKKFIIAGGITENNIKSLLDVYVPKAIDLSSSLEDEMGKNLNKIIKFKECFERITKKYE